MNFMKISYRVSPYNFLNIFKFYLDLKLLAKSWFLQAQKKENQNISQYCKTETKIGKNEMLFLRH